MLRAAAAGHHCAASSEERILMQRKNPASGTFLPLLMATVLMSVALAAAVPGADVRGPASGPDAARVERAGARSRGPRSRPAARSARRKGGRREAAILSAATPAPAAACSMATASGAAPGSAGLRVAIDPETGMPVPPSPEQLRAFEEASAGRLDHSAEGLEVVTLPDGTKMVRLQGRFMEYAVALRDSAGRPRVRCVHGAEAAESLLRGARAGPGAPAEK
jgi:hypothetical protein